MSGGGGSHHVTGGPWGARLTAATGGQGWHQHKECLERRRDPGSRRQLSDDGPLMAAMTDPGDNHDNGTAARLPALSPGPVGPQDDIAELAATGGAVVAAIVAQRWNEANRSWLQRRIGAAPFRQAREEMNVRVGALLGGTLTFLLANGAAAGLDRLHDRSRRREVARTVGQVLGAAATAPDGSVPRGGRPYRRCRPDGHGRGGSGP